MTLNSSFGDLNNLKIGIMSTCLVDMFRPEIAKSTQQVIERTCTNTKLPNNQTCCGQPAYNSGEMTAARRVAKGTIKRFENFDIVVVPSGSCAGMVRIHYEALFADDEPWRLRAHAVAEKTYEFAEFCAAIELPDVPMHSSGHGRKATYHDSCSGLRELKVKDQPRRLLENAGNSIVEMRDSESCCGFGGMFCVKHPDVSSRIADMKLDDAVATGAEVFVAGDLGCLLHLVGRAKRRGLKLKFRHFAEMLNSGAPEFAIGEAE